MEPKVNLSKRQYVLVVEGRKEQSTWSQESNEWIYKYYLHFKFGRKHLKNSEHPPGYYETGYASGEVNIHWLFNETSGYFAPEVSFPGREQSSYKMVAKLAKAMDKIPTYSQGPGYDWPQALIAAVKASVVEYHEGGWRTYRPLRVHGESGLQTLARAAD